jgi:hypothetical protein
MKFSKLSVLALLSMGLSLAASAKEFRLPLSTAGENPDGNYASLLINKGLDGSVVYELVPATNEVAAALKAKKCPDGAKLDASILTRTLSFDEENHQPGVETVKLLVRKLECIAP